MTRSLPEVTEYIGVDEIQTGNTDIGTQTWTGRKEREETPPLPIYPSVWDQVAPAFDAVIRNTAKPVDPMATPIPKLPGRAGKEL